MTGLRRWSPLLPLPLLLLLLLPAQAGNPYSSASKRRIVGGRFAPENAYPFQVSITVVTKDGRQIHYCGASVLDANHLITAAHCCNLPKESMLVVAGVNDLSNKYNPQRVERLVAELIPHEKFDSTSMANDIALVRLASPLPEGDPRIAAVTLRKTPAPNWTQCVVIGWGHTGGADADAAFSPRLRMVEQPLLEQQQCSAIMQGLGSILLPGMMCAGDLVGGRDACVGDSGGPLVCQGELTGVVSWGKGCALPGHPGIYTDVLLYLPWLGSALRRSYAAIAG